MLRMEVLQQTELKKKTDEAKAWIKENSTALAFAGISIFSVILGLRRIKSFRELKKYMSSLEIQLKHTPQPPSVQTLPAPAYTPVDSLLMPTVRARPTPHEVRSHIRNLPSGRKASAEKVATALEHNYNLQDGQTWVSSYRTGI